MDALKKAAQKVGGSESKDQSTQSQPQGQAGMAGQAGQKEDYGDKAFAAGVKKTGYNIDREQQEKITDAGRGAFEKATGKNIPDKFSN